MIKIATHSDLGKLAKIYATCSGSVLRLQVALEMNQIPLPGYEKDNQLQF